MPSDLLISATELAGKIAAHQVLVFDCSYELMTPAAGRQAFEKEHIPGAVFADLHDDLSTHGERRASGGRHPLPLREDFALWLRDAGLSKDSLVVIYDRNRFNFGGRLWWMMRWAGHGNIRVLDGGLQAWVAQGLPLESGPPQPRVAGDFELARALETLVSAEEVLARLQDPAQVLVDARAPERFRGEVEPLDPVAGHIPGALNRPFLLNVEDSGHFKSPAQLRTEYSELFKDRPDNADVVAYCGSGASATPIVFTMRLAGLPAPALYAGSWSEWSGKGLPAATGPATGSETGKV